jgi:hypothetical protein
MESAAATRVGDFNGDGVADLAIPDPSGRPHTTLTIVEGRSEGVRLQRVVDISMQRLAGWVWITDGARRGPLIGS